MLYNISIIQYSVWDKISKRTFVNVFMSDFWHFQSPRYVSISNANIIKSKYCTWFKVYFQIQTLNIVKGWWILVVYQKQIQVRIDIQNNCFIILSALFKDKDYFYRRHIVFEVDLHTKVTAGDHKTQWTPWTLNC